MTDNIPSIKMLYKNMPELWINKDGENSFKIEVPLGMNIIFGGDDILIAEEFNYDLNDDEYACEYCALQHTIFCSYAECWGGWRKDGKYIYFIDALKLLSNESIPKVYLEFKNFEIFWQNTNYELDPKLQLPIGTEIIIDEKKVTVKRNPNQMLHEQDVPPECNLCFLKKSKYCKAFRCIPYYRVDRENVYFENTENN